MSIYSIYKATNTTNGKVYIGFTADWPRRKTQHLEAAHRDSSSIFHQALRKYGPDAFEWEVLCQSKDGDHLLNEMEPHFIKEYNSLCNTGHGYNVTTGGRGAVGVKRSSEAKAHYREAALNRWNSDRGQEERKERSEAWSGEQNPMYGKPGTMLGKTLSEESKAKVSKFAKERFKDKTNHPRYGVKMSEETKKKIGDANRGKIFSEEHKRKLSEANKGKVYSAETRRKISDINAKTYELTSPTGEKMIVTNLSKWCREHNYRRENMLNNQVRGWTCRKLSK